MSIFVSKWINVYASLADFDNSSFNNSELLTSKKNLPYDSETTPDFVNFFKLLRYDTHCHLFLMTYFDTSLMRQSHSQ